MAPPASLAFVSTGTSAGTSLYAFRYRDRALVRAGHVGLNRARHWMIRGGAVRIVDLDWA